MGKLISISGLIGSGKDTIANYLVEEHNFVQLSFSSTLKDCLSIIFGWDREMLDGKTKEHRLTRDRIDVKWAISLGRPMFTPRFAMTHIGTDIMRKCFDDQIWVLALKNKIEKLLEQNPDINIVVSDARYENELEMLKSLGFNSLEVIRGQYPDWMVSGMNYKKSKSVLGKLALKFYYTYLDKNPNIFNKNIHTSEYDWITWNFDRAVFNNDTIHDLTDRVKCLLLKELI